MGDIAKAIGKVVEPPKKDCCKKARKYWEDEDDEEEDFEPSPIPPKCCKKQQGGWEVKGKPANEDLRFGYGLQVDEPRKQDYDDWDDFLDARGAYDDFVDAGERCVELGLEKTNDAPITKCQAIRKPIGTKPPFNKDLLGESQFPWWERPCIL